MYLDINLESNKADRVAERLLIQLMSKDLRDPQPLASERLLMKEFNVSRLVCREALAKLRGMGFVRTWHGKGNFLVKPGNGSLTTETLQYFAATGQITNKDILAVRLLIEPATAAMAASNAGKADYKSTIENLVNTQIDNDFLKLPLIERAQKYAVADVSFHQAIAAASGNPIMPILLKSLHELLLKVRLETLILKPDIIRRAVNDHKKIAEFISRGDVDNARKAMERHIKSREKELHN
jgi:GntR family transcriptional regulator, transcriptional repressor for pyruvate dehydrogenase complex